MTIAETRPRETTDRDAAAGEDGRDEAPLRSSERYINRELSWPSLRRDS